MVKQSLTAEMIFSLDQANAMLPLLRLIVADISLSHRELSERKHQLHRLVRRGSANQSSLHQEEINETREDLRIETKQLEEYISELEGLGVVLRSAYDGIVNFPTVMRNQAAYYCWKMGDRDVAFWHWPNESFADRRPLSIDRSNAN